MELLEKKIQKEHYDVSYSIRIVMMDDNSGVNQVESFLSDNCPPMGIYETLYAFRDLSLIHI